MLLEDNIDPLAHASQAKSNGTCADGIFFLKTGPRIPSHQENDTHTKSGPTPAARRESKIETNSSYSPPKFPLIIARNTSISKKYSSSYMFSFSGMNNDHMEKSFYIMTISM